MIKSLLKISSQKHPRLLPFTALPWIEHVNKSKLSTFSKVQALRKIVNNILSKSTIVKCLSLGRISMTCCTQDLTAMDILATMSNFIAAHHLIYMDSVTLEYEITASTSNSIFDALGIVFQCQMALNKNGKLSRTNLEGWQLRLIKYSRHNQFDFLVVCVSKH